MTLLLLPVPCHFLGDDVTPEFEHLRQTELVAVAHQGLAGRDVALLDAPKTNVHGMRALLTVARWRYGEDQRDIDPRPRPIVFDEACICRQVYRQFMRNKLARFYHHRTRKCMPP